jgi:hypothetical protein
MDIKTVDDLYPPLSSNKETFLNQGIWEPYQLAAKDIDTLIYHYSKQGIRLIKNGQRSGHLEQKKEEIRKQIQRLEDNTKKYATYLQMNFALNKGRCDNFFVSEYCNCSSFLEYYGEIKNSIKEFLAGTGKIKTDLSKNELSKLNEIASQLTCVSLFNSKVASQIKDLKNQLPNVCLDKTEVMQEIEEIRKKLKADEKVGYIFTNQTNLEIEHFEVLILTRKAIIKPIHWPKINSYYALMASEVIGGIPMHLTDLSLFTINSSINLPHPQGKDNDSCGFLGIAYLKKLLQTDATELKSLSLSFSFYNHQGKKRHFFLPSPTVFRYSQSSKYILFLEKIMQEKETEKYEGHSILTLQSLLAKSIHIAKEKNNTVMLKQNENTLNCLAKLRPEWQTTCEQVKEKREKMQDPSSKHNLYLDYTTHRLRKLSDQEANAAYTFLVQLVNYIAIKTNKEKGKKFLKFFRSREQEKITLAEGLKIAVEKFLSYPTGITLFMDAYNQLIDAKNTLTNKIKTSEQNMFLLALNNLIHTIETTKEKEEAVILPTIMDKVKSEVISDKKVLENNANSLFKPKIRKTLITIDQILYGSDYGLENSETSNNKNVLGL